VSLEDAAPRLPVCLGELNAGVDAEVDAGIHGAVGGDRMAGLPQDGQDVADVVLAGDVVVRDPAERVGEGARLEGVGARVDLMDR
jgi:hypothetical protein